MGKNKKKSQAHKDHQSSPTTSTTGEEPTPASGAKEAPVAPVISVQAPPASPEKRSSSIVDHTLEWQGAGQKVGLQAWRIESMKAVPWTQLGQFYSGDSYLILSTIAVGKKYDLFYWLGKESTVDEKGAAALKTVELDTHLGDVPVQYRECEGHESGPFLSLWKPYGGIRYLSGGVASSFTHVEPENYVTKLLHVKGKRLCRVSEVEKSVKSMNEGDAFVLDAGLKLFVWKGKDCNKYEEQKACEVARAIRTERGSKPEVFLFDAIEDDVKETFWKELGGGTAADVASASAGGSDEMHEQVASEKIKLYSVSADLSLSAVSGASVPFDRDALKDDGVFVLDSGAAQPGLFVRLGKSAPSDLKKQAVGGVTKWLAAEGRPEYTGIARMDAGTESALFKTYFKQFDPVRMPSVTLEVESSGVAKTRGSEVSVADMHSGRQASSSRGSTLSTRDAAREAVKIWRIENFDTVEVAEDAYGQFFAGDSYIVEYVYRAENGRIEDALLYFWQGEDSTADEKGSSAILCAKLDQERFGGEATQVRVVQGKEPSDFIRIFHGKMIIHKGGCDSGFRSVLPGGEEEQVDAAAFPKLYHIRGASTAECKATQVKCEAKNLNSNDVLALFESPTVAFIWHGAGASPEEQKLGDELVQTCAEGAKVDIVKESSEPETFWTLLGGKTEYASDPALANPDFEPRLFQVSNASGALRVEEIFDFQQTDLIDEDVMLLDTFSAVYVWVGPLAHKEEREEAPKIAAEYITSSPDGRSADSTPVVLVKPENEPLLFTCHFVGWDASKKKGFVDLYAERKTRRNSAAEAEKEAAEKALEAEAAERAEKVQQMEAERESEKKRAQEAAEAEKDEAERKTFVELRRTSNADKVATSATTSDGAPAPSSGQETSTSASSKESTQNPTMLTSGSPKSPVPRRSSVKGRRNSVSCCFGNSSSTEELVSSDHDGNMKKLLDDEKGGDVIGPESVALSQKTLDETTTVLSARTSTTTSQKKKGANGRWSMVDTGGYLGFGNINRTSQTSATDENKNNSEPTYACHRSTKYSLVELQHGKRPDDVDPTKKEMYLESAEFHSVFGIPVDDYEKMPGWRKTQKKKEKGLF
ncbi:unnamed protein product [Amoebophrya sp. A25]|nr:unnamed protein product [Amoebophrya sp. A25]|eukprot:GSA25T00002921001.1